MVHIYVRNAKISRRQNPERCAEHELSVYLDVEAHLPQLGVVESEQLPAGRLDKLVHRTL